MRDRGARGQIRDQAESLARSLKRLKEGANLRIRPILGANILAADNAIAVDHVGLRPHIGMEELGRGLRGSRTVMRSTWRRAMKLVVGVGILVDAHGQDDQVGLVVVELEKGRQFDDAGLAPGGPEVEQHNLAAIVGQVDRVWFRRRR